MSLQDRAQTLADLAVKLQQEPGEKPTAVIVLARALELVPDAVWASLTIRARRTSYLTLAATSPEAQRADELQYRLGEGPCVDAASDVDWCRSGSVGDDKRWPAWGPEAADVGIRSLLSVRLATRGVPLGALNLYAPQAGRFEDRDEVSFALLYAAHVAVALTSAKEIEGLHSAVASRHVIGLAQGMLMERYGLSVETSFELLRRYSSTHNVKLAQIAADLVSTRELPSSPGAGEPSRAEGDADPV